jgi:glycosyltransferase involved in cell wall biosynthesis
MMAGSPRIRVATVGMSFREPCGVRDHAVALADAMSSDELACELLWLKREERSLPRARQEVQGWLETLGGYIRAISPQVTLLHYSVFSYSQQGVPLFVPSMMRVLRRAGVPMIVMLHEFAFPWTADGMRGKVWAITQRAALIEVMRASRSAVVTTDARAQWLASRRWLPQRQTVVVPVFSNMPLPSTTPHAVVHDSPTIALFGYSYGSATVRLVLDAIALIRRRGTNAELHLLGAPGPSSSTGREWVCAARERGMSDVLSFSGILSAQALADRLAACDVLVFADPVGPTSRKGTLAAALCSGRPVVAVAGSQTWPTLVEQDAVTVVAPSAARIAEVLSAFLGDTELCAAVGARGRDFADRHMSVASAASAVRGLVSAQLKPVRDGGVARP